MVYKVLIGGFIISIVTIFVINVRTPFYTDGRGPWSIGYGYSSNVLEQVDVSRSDIFSLNDIKTEAPSSILLADPFFLYEKDTFYLFFEHITQKSDGASIGVLTSSDGKKYKFKGTALDEEFHLSYPHVFKYKNQFYMLPETKNANNVLLYVAENFPFNWKIRDTLVHNVKLVDPSIYVSDTLNIMVATDHETIMTLYQADRLDGKWKPVKELLRGSESRAGGRIFAYQNKLYLPVQNAARGYGDYLSLYQFEFKGKEIFLKKVKDKILHEQPDIPQFTGAMHHLDIQKIGDSYYNVYDGLPAIKEEQTFNWVHPLKFAYLDFINLFN